MRGPKPLPRNVVELRGNPGKRPLNEDEPVIQPITELPEPPRKLKLEAKREWKRVIPYIIGNRLVGEESLSVLATYCTLHAAMVLAEKKGELPPAAYISQYRSLAGEFGLTPSARTRIKAGGNAKKTEEEKRFFG